MNHIPEVAKMLGVEVGEVFKIEDSAGAPVSKGKFTDRGLVVTAGDMLVHPAGPLLVALITGECKVVKLPWKPGKSDNFYFVNYMGLVNALSGSSGSTLKAGLILMGNCFRTKAEAEAHKDEIMEKYKGVFKE